MKTQTSLAGTTSSKTMAARLRSACASGMLPLLFLIMAPAATQAQFTYTINDGQITITGYTGAGGAVTIPPFIFVVNVYLPVTSIGDSAFFNLTNVTSVTILNPVTNIGYYAFYHCTSLTNVTIPNSVISIGRDAFEDCASLTSVTIPNSVTSIGYSAFAFCNSLTNLTLGIGVTNIGDSAFSECFSLTSVTIPDFVTSIGIDAFMDCTRLANITIGNSVVIIGDSAFAFCTSLTSVTIPNSVTSIGAAPFAFCTSLTAIIVGTNNPAYSSAAGILFDKSQTALIEYPEGKAGTSYAIPNVVTRIGDSAFVYCTSLTEIIIPNSVTSIGNNAFEACTSLSSIKIPNSVTNIEAYAFEFCTNLASVTIGSSVTSIAGGAFLECLRLTSVTIPNSVINIRSYAFAACSNLTSVYFQGNAPYADSTVFQDDNNATVYYLPGTTGWASTFDGRPTVQLAAITVQTEPAGLSFAVDGTNYTATQTFDWAPGSSHTISAISPQSAGAGAQYAWTNWSDEGALSHMAAPAGATTYTASFTEQYYLTMNSGGNGTISPPSGWQNLGANVPISPTPNGGYVFSGWTGTGPGSYSGTNNPAMVVMTGDIVETASFVPGQFIPGKGTYSGLIYDTNGVKPESSGSFTITTTAKRKFSASLQIGGARYSFSGEFDGTGYASRPAKSGGVSVNVVLQMDLVPNSDRITGTVSSAAGWTAELAGDLAVFDGKTSIAPQAGQKYTMIVPGGIASEAAPGGDGYGVFSVSKTGIISLVGALADGTRISQKATVSKYGQWPLYVPLYSGQGSILGWLTFTNEPLEDLTGELTWIKPQGKGPYYANGFTTETTASGSIYQPPATGHLVLDFTNPAQLVLSGGNLVESLTNDISLSANNKVTSTNDAKLRLIFALPTGLFSGKIADANTDKLIPFNGVVFQKANMGAGFFLGTDQSGPVLIGTPGPAL